MKFYMQPTPNGTGVGRPGGMMPGLQDICLRLFDGGAGAAAPAGGEGSGVSGAQAGSQASPGSSRRGKSGGMDSVVYGRRAAAEPPQDGAAEQGSDAGSEQQAEQPAKPTLAERRKAYQALIEGEYKDLFEADTQRIIDRRLRDYKGLQETLTAQSPVIQMLMDRYKVADGDVQKLAQAIEADDTYWTQAAEEAGMNVDQFKQYKRMQRENEAFRQAQLHRQADEAAQRQASQWLQQAEEVKRTYPGFDFESEVTNPQFLAMLRSGIPVQHAYEVFHMDEIKAGAAQQAAKQTEKAVVENIRAKGARPTENGVNSQSGITIKSDVSKLTAKDRAEIARRAARGEQIAF